MVTIPTIDQISGSTVMNKMRSLINAFINFATEIDADLTVISTQASNAYDLATDTAGQFADLQALVQNNYYTKSETDTLLGRRAYQFNVTAPLYKIQYSAYEDSVGIHLDGETVINGNSGLAVNIDDDTLYYDSVGGKVKALTYSAGVGTSMNLAREISVNLSDGLYVNTNNAIMTKVDGETIKFDSNGVMYVPIDNSTIKVDANTGLISADAGGSDWELVTTTDWATDIVSNDGTNITFLKDAMIQTLQGITPNLIFKKGEVHKATEAFTSNYAVLANDNSFITLQMTYYTFGLLFATGNTITTKHGIIKIMTTKTIDTVSINTTRTIEKVTDLTTVVSAPSIRLYVKN